MSGGLGEASTRERLIEAAGCLFAEKGFEGATIRHICEAAGANVAAVNYHFRDKDGLYAEVVAEVVADVIRRRTEKFPMDGGLGEDAAPEERLRAFVQAFLRRRFDRDGSGWWGRLLAREMRSPCEAVRAVLERERRANRRLLVSIVNDVLGPGAGPETAERCAASVVGQVLHYFHGHHASPAGSGDQEMTPERIEELARHIAEFSAGGMACVRARRSHLQAVRTGAHRSHLQAVRTGARRKVGRPGM
jgi:AcrR family transcriptional regulator